MNVQAVGNHREMVPFGKGFENVKPVEERVLDQAVKPDTDVPPSGIEAAETGEKGVIRLLQESHFRGVADVRLRINFHEELQRLNTQSAQAAFEGGLPDLIERIQEAKSLFGFTDGTPDDLALDSALADFAARADGTLASVQDGSLDLSAALKELRDAFSDLAKTLGETFGDAPAPEVEDTEDGSTTVSAVLETIPSDGYEIVPAATLPETDPSPLESLQITFDGEIGKLEAAMSESLALPPLSEPSGKGAAYGKFLEIYNSLTWGWKPEAGTQEQAAGIDVLA